MKYKREEALQKAIEKKEFVGGDAVIVNLPDRYLAMWSDSDCAEFPQHEYMLRVSYDNYIEYSELFHF